MKAITSAVFALLLAVPAVAYGQNGLSDADIEKAIALGRAHKLGGIVETCTAKRDTGGFMTSGLIGAAVSAASVSFDVTIAGSMGRIALAAQGAQGRPGTADFGNERSSQSVTVTAAPTLPDSKGAGSMDLPPTIKKITIVATNDIQSWDTNERPKPPRTFEPLQSDVKTSAWKNAGGATIDYPIMSATFDGSALGSIRENDIRLTLDTSAGARSCKLSQRTILRLLTGK